MRVPNILCTLASSWLLVTLPCTFLSIAHGQDSGALLGDPADYWLAGFTSPVAVSPLPLIEDSSLEQVQMLAPQRRSGVQLAQRSRNDNTANRESSLASVPFMIGDTGAGTCLSYGSFLAIDLGHPTLSCSRLNVSEANTPIPTDRIYYSYRHFHNATPTNVFGIAEDFNLDRHTLAAERTFFDRMMSCEVRLPLEYRLNSTLGSYDINPTDPTLTFPPGFDPLYGFGSDRRTELGNVSFIFKALLRERPGFALSAGLGVTLPTARDVTLDATIDDYIFFTEDPFLARYAIQISSIAANETVYLSPFLAWVCQPTERFFHQGFLQVEVAANDSFFTVGGGGLAAFDTNYNNFVSNNFFDAGDTYVDFSTFFPIGVGKIQPQTILRLNLGWGYVLSENARADWIQKLTGLFEVHYSSTLNQATIAEVPLEVRSGGFVAGFDSITLGNPNNKVDIVNVVTGLSANMGNWVMTHGVTVPVTTGSNRGFDFEYNMQLQRIF